MEFSFQELFTLDSNGFENGLFKKYFFENAIWKYFFSKISCHNKGPSSYTVKNEINLGI